MAAASPAPTSSRAFFMGCWDDIGHHLRDQHGRLLHWTHLPAELRGLHFDGGFLPSLDRQRDDQPEGVAALHHILGGDWTVLSFWDRSVDPRNGSHSTYVVEGRHDFAAAVSLARATFPRVWARYRFEVRAPGPEHSP